jgi:hypothetical protein
MLKVLDDLILSSVPTTTGPEVEQPAIETAINRLTANFASVIAFSSRSKNRETAKHRSHVTTSVKVIASFCSVQNTNSRNRCLGSSALDPIAEPLANSRRREAAIAPAQLIDRPWLNTKDVEPPDQGRVSSSSR